MLTAHLRKQAHVHKYISPLDVVERVAEEWAEVTGMRLPVIGWPIDDRIEIRLMGEIPESEHESVKDALRAHFDGERVIFPLIDVDIEDHGMVTAIRVIGNRERASEMMARPTPPAS